MLTPECMCPNCFIGRTRIAQKVAPFCFGFTVLGLLAALWQHPLEPHAWCFLISGVTFWWHVLHERLVTNATTSPQGTPNDHEPADPRSP